jgi:hypothetical protein
MYTFTKVDQKKSIVNQKFLLLNYSVLGCLLTTNCESGIFQYYSKFYILTAEAVLKTSFTILESAVKSALNGHDDMPHHV